MFISSIFYLTTLFHLKLFKKKQHSESADKLVALQSVPNTFSPFAFRFISDFAGIIESKINAPGRHTFEGIKRSFKRAKVFPINFLMNFDKEEVR